MLFDIKHIILIKSSSTKIAKRMWGARRLSTKFLIINILDFCICFGHIFVPISTYYRLVRKLCTHTRILKLNASYIVQYVNRERIVSTLWALRVFIRSYCERTVRGRIVYSHWTRSRNVRLSASDRDRSVSALSILLIPAPLYECKASTLWAHNKDSTYSPRHCEVTEMSVWCHVSVVSLWAHYPSPAPVSPQ